MDGLKMLYPSRRAEPQPRGKAPDDFTSLAAKAKDNCLNTLVLALGSGDSSAAARIKQLESELELERGLREGLEKQVAAFKKRMADIMQNPDIEGAWQAAAAANTCEWPRTPTRTRTHSPPRASPTRFPNPTAPASVHLALLLQRHDVFTALAATAPARSSGRRLGSARTVPPTRGAARRATP